MCVRNSLTYRWLFRRKHIISPVCRFFSCDEFGIRDACARAHDFEISRRWLYDDDDDDGVFSSFENANEQNGTWYFTILSLNFFFFFFCFKWKRLTEHYSLLSIHWCDTLKMHTICRHFFSLFSSSLFLLFTLVCYDVFLFLSALSLNLNRNNFPNQFFHSQMSCTTARATKKNTLKMINNYE